MFKTTKINQRSDAITITYDVFSEFLQGQH